MYDQTERRKNHFCRVIKLDFLVLNSYRAFSNFTFGITGANLGAASKTHFKMEYISIHADKCSFEDKYKFIFFTFK